jgi:hypothetical protein
MELQQEEHWPWVGLIFEVQPHRQKQIKLLGDIDGLSDDERYFLRAICFLSSDSGYNRCDQVGIESYLAENNKKSSLSLIKKRAREFHNLELFERYETPRPNNRPAVVYALADLTKVLASPSKALLAKIEESEYETVLYGKRSLNVDDPLQFIEGQDVYPHSYTQKINHVVLRRCSRNPDYLGKKVALTLPGYGETVQVIQRTASGIPPMDGSEDRLQQALLTMFKEHIEKCKLQYPHLVKKDFKNEWILDLRQACKTMRIQPSNANIKNQAKKLYQIRHNSFEIFFNPDGKAAKQLNLINSLGEAIIPELYADEHTLHRLEQEQADQQFLSKLEPLIDEVVWSDLEQPDVNPKREKRDFNLLKEGDIEDFELDDLVTDANGSPYRFYRLSFFEKVYDECLDDALGQINKNPPSLLNEDRKTARLLAYLAQRICNKSRSYNPFMISWGSLAHEIQPVEETQKNVFQSLERIFKTEYKAPGNSEVEWSPSGDCIVNLHGFCFKTTIPNGKSRKRASWQLMMWRDPKDSYTGDNGPAAMAYARSEFKQLTESLKSDST